MRPCSTALHLVLPGMRREGVVLADKTRLTYKLNGRGLHSFASELNLSNSRTPS